MPFLVFLGLYAFCMTLVVVVVLFMDWFGWWVAERRLKR